MNDLDKELDEILTAFYKKTVRVDGNTPEARAEAKAKIQRLITEARIDELKDFRKNWHTMIRQEVHQDLNDRIAKLTKLEAEL